MRLKFISLLIFFPAVLYAGNVFTLDSCRNMALSGNKSIKIAREGIEGAEYLKKSARAAYLPALDFEGTYVYNQKNLSLLGKDISLSILNFDLVLVPKNALTVDIHNVFAGALTLTQPVFMGGKIRAMNEITKYATILARNRHDMAVENVIYEVDEAYWLVVSLKSKERLAHSYVSLLDTLNANVSAMVEQGVATKADALSVAVKLNEAHVDLTKVENGLKLSRMLLAQLCGMPLNTEFTLADEDKEPAITVMPAEDYNMQEVYSRRSDVKALESVVNIFEQKAKAERAAMMPQVAVVGAYSVSNPNLFNGFKKEFDGMFSVGAMIKIPIWHWGGNYNKYRAAKSEAVVRKLELEDAKEKISLQVNQASFKMQEAIKMVTAAKSNLESAKENLRMAQLGFQEGMLTAEQVMEAQTAWLMAESEALDACIDLRMCEVYLSKALGTLDREITLLL